jgi:hypothetical protein
MKLLEIAHTSSQYKKNIAHAYRNNIGRAKNRPVIKSSLRKTKALAEYT